MPPNSPTTAPTLFHLHSRASRTVAALLYALGRGSLPALLVAVVLADDPPISTGDLMLLLILLALLPTGMKSVVQLRMRATVSVEGDVLVLDRDGLRLEIPRDAIAAVEPWRLPWPEPGVALRMASGRRLPHGLSCSDPDALCAALEGFGGAAVVEHPSFAWARSRPRRTQPASRRWLFKFVLFGLLPAGVFYYTHQSIAFGGPFGQLHRQGFAPYLAGYVLYWTTVTLYLVLFAGLWRGLAEWTVFAAAWAAPPRVAGVRRWAEAAARWLYFGGVPVLVATRYLA